MLWFYESFFPVVWIFFLLYWQIKAANTKTTQRLEPAASPHPPRLILPVPVLLPFVTSHPAPLALPPALAGWLLALLAGSCRHHRRPSVRRLGARAPRRNWSRSVTIKQGHELITTGPYALVRHPIYTGILTGFLGMAIAISQVRGFIVFALIFLAFWIKLRMEEQWMHSKFGEAYTTYAHQTAALVPYLL